MAVFDEHFDNTISRDFFRLCCGDLLGSGVYREVYEWKLDRSLVVKIEDGSQAFQNIIEWETWRRVRDVEGICDWFAPCVEISSCGTVLLQRRTMPPKRYPEKIPAFLVDLKRANYGMIGRRFVCHDYGSHLLMENGMTKRMKRADWWG